VAVDKFDREDKNANLQKKSLWHKIDRNDFISWLGNNHEEVEFIFHLGARTDTAEFDRAVLWTLNTIYSKTLWNKCVEYQIPLIYASSAATYGSGELGYSDDVSIIDKLKPLNAYGSSKNEFDKWVISQNDQPFFWAGLKFFNVYGPNEYHKSRMASVVFHAYHQIRSTNGMKLFRSHNPHFADGEQMRDFIYVKDVINVCYYLMRHRRNSGIYNLGSGKARTFIDLTKAVFKALEKEDNISFIDTPADIREKYQYFTEADMKKLRNAGYQNDFYSLEDGIQDYVVNYLLGEKYF
jgi:ADP-L-glycero-D-manno-heptose 6-epimerase